MWRDWKVGGGRGDSRGPVDVLGKSVRTAGAPRDVWKERVGRAYLAGIAADWQPRETAVATDQMVATWLLLPHGADGSDGERRAVEELEMAVKIGGDRALKNKVSNDTRSSSPSKVPPAKRALAVDVG